ncbi:uncharacterized protein KD926_004156 [Aspergillus affinis]|uniref:uncharacterized protein n=1 Tax=Aspergillus affinis TaxID=1070780 RepID=UPI0022FF3627|nr:uncharacterized protein KD926_004156 [Aspergillus affinis]KAI9046318.1 hypothetical protein KD926_004156 [Aspergillus affinis]
MPLLDIVGMTATGDTFYAAFGFMHNETEDTYGFILKCLSDTLFYYECGYPRVIVTDKEKGLYNAIEKEFNFTDHILCIWHIQKVIMTKCRPILRKEVIRIKYEGDSRRAQDNKEFSNKVENEWKSFFGFFMQIVNSISEEEIIVTTANLKAEYSGDVWQPIYTYLDENWLEEDTAKRFIKFYTNEFRHFGQEATSRNEGAHWVLKKDLLVSTKDLLGTAQSIALTITDRYRKVWNSIEDNRQKRPHHLRMPIFSQRELSAFEYELSQEQPVRRRKRNNQERRRRWGLRDRGNSTETIEVDKDDRNSDNENEVPTNEENGETSEKEEVELLRRSQRASRSKAAQWLGDEN